MEDDLEKQDILDGMRQCLIKGQTAQLNDFIKTAVDSGLYAGEILDDGLISGMNVIAERFQRKESYFQAHKLG